MLPQSFHFIRHGETSWNQERRIQGWEDIPLNETGRAQAQDAIPAILEFNIDLIVASTLQRAFETAEILNTALNVPLLPEPDLRERCFGNAQGCYVADVLQKGLWEEPDYTPEGAETMEEFQTRILTGAKRHLDANPDKSVLFVAHGGMYRVLNDRLLQGAPTGCKNAIPFTFTKAHTTWSVTESRFTPNKTETNIAQ